MALHSRLNVLISMKQVGMIPVFYNSDFEISRNVIAACADGGAKVFEFVNRGDRAINVFSKLREEFANKRPEIILGVGSIVDDITAGMYINAGADFVVGPMLDEDVARICNKRKVPYLPGCGTVTEIQKAHELGVEICKVFPGSSVGGPSFVKAVKGPIPWASIMPTGGVSPTEESLTEWFNAGIVCTGLGSQLITKELLDNKDYAGIMQKVKSIIELVKKIRE